MKGSGDDRFALLQLGGLTMGMGVVGGMLVPCPAASVLVLLGGVIIATHFVSKGKYDDIFYNLKIGCRDTYPLYLKKIQKDNTTVYEYTLPAGLTLDSFEKHKDALETYTGKPIDLSLHNKHIFLTEYNNGEQVQYDYVIEKLKGNVPLLIGYNRRGDLVSVDLSEGEPHMYIAGETGSGKSTALRAIITNLILTKDVDLFLVDLKNGVELSIFQGCEKVKSFAKTEIEAFNLFEYLLNESSRRYNVFAEAGCKDIKSYNKKHRMKYTVLVVDEYASLMGDKKCEKVVALLVQKARASGIHVILSTQRPSADIITGNIKANITNVLGLKTIDKTNSRIVIDHDGLEKLRGKGHGVLKSGGNETIIQCPYLPEEQAQTMIAPYCRTERPTQKKDFVGGLRNVDRP